MKASHTHLNPGRRSGYTDLVKRHTRQDDEEAKGGRRYNDRGAEEAKLDWDARPGYQGSTLHRWIYLSRRYLEDLTEEAIDRKKEFKGS